MCVYLSEWFVWYLLLFLAETIDFINESVPSSLSLDYSSSFDIGVTYSTLDTRIIIAFIKNDNDENDNNRYALRSIQVNEGVGSVTLSLPFITNKPKVPSKYSINIYLVSLDDYLYDNINCIDFSFDSKTKIIDITSPSSSSSLITYTDVKYPSLLYITPGLIPSVIDIDQNSFNLNILYAANTVNNYQARLISVDNNDNSKIVTLGTY